MSNPDDRFFQPDENIEYFNQNCLNIVFQNIRLSDWAKKKGYTRIRYTVFSVYRYNMAFVQPSNVNSHNELTVVHSY